MSQAVLIAVGIDWDGRRQILAVEMANRVAADDRPKLVAHGRTLTPPAVPSNQWGAIAADAVRLNCLFRLGGATGNPAGVGKTLQDGRVAHASYRFYRVDARHANGRSP